MAKDRGDILKGLGVQRRRPGGATEAPDAAADEAKSSDEGEAATEGPKEIKGLGIKRRSRGDSGRQQGGGGGGGSGLGIKRRSGGGASSESASEDGGEGKSDAAPAKASPLGAAKGKLGADDTAVMLANHFKCRPDLPAKIPARVWDLHRTHGRYAGDGRAEREIVIGWEAAYVLWVIPAWPEGMPEFEKKPPFKMIDPGPPPQPRFTERGFVVDESLNEIGEWYYYVVFRSDGEPLALPEPEPDEAKRAPKQKKRQDGAKPRGLGIKRRRK